MKEEEIEMRIRKESMNIYNEIDKIVEVINNYEKEIKENNKKAIQKLNGERNEFMGKIKELEKKMEESEKRNESKILELENKIKNINEKLNESNEKNIKLEAQMNKDKSVNEKNKKLILELNEKLKNIEEWKEKYKNEFNEFIQNKISQKIVDSKIIRDKNDIKFINDNVLKKKNIIWKLLYRATIDGSNPSDFHKKVDNKGLTLSIIKTKKGIIFGVFTNISYTSENDYKYVLNHFYFQLI
jgi:chromosome segregation ATPase